MQTAGEGTGVYEVGTVPAKAARPSQIPGGLLIS